MTKKTRIDIAACTDRQFVMPTGVMMQSVCVNNPDVDIMFHIIVNDDITDGDKRDLEDVTAPFCGKSVVFYRASEYIKNIDFPALENSPLTESTYYRLWLAEMLPIEVEKVLYLDGDVIVRHSLLLLWNTDIEGYAVAAVPDSLEGQAEFYSRLNYSPSFGYFNAGVLLVNLKYWRGCHVQTDFVRFIREFSDIIKFHDQDVLNCLFKESKVILPLIYNLTSAFLWRKPEFNTVKYAEELATALIDPVVVHFASPEKPWYAYQREQHPFRSTFLKYQNQTKWRDVKTDRRPLRLRIINYVADLLRRMGLKPQLEKRYNPITPID
jgi:lipopolysaccharide biosynthesis glycosyltransferase